MVLPAASNCAAAWVTGCERQLAARLRLERHDLVADDVGAMVGGVDALQRWAEHDGELGKR